MSIGFSKLYVYFYEVFKMQINERIFYLLEQQHKSAKDLGKYIGVNPSSISAWKNEGSFPSSKYIVGISEFLNVSLDYLCTGIEKTKSSLSNDRPTQDHVLSDDEFILLERFNALDIAAKSDLLDYAQYKVFQSFQNSNNSLQNKKENNKIQGKYIPLDQKNSDDIIA